MAWMNAWGRGWVEEPGWEDAVRNHRARNKVSHDNAIYVSLSSEWLSDPHSLISDLKYICIYLERGKVQWRACGSQRTTSRNHFSLCTMTALGTEPHHQSWRQAPSPAGSSHYFLFFYHWNTEIWTDPLSRCLARFPCYFLWVFWHLKIKGLLCKVQHENSKP